MRKAKLNLKSETRKAKNENRLKKATREMRKAKVQKRRKSAKCEKRNAKFLKIFRYDGKSLEICQLSALLQIKASTESYNRILTGIMNINYILPK
ncbi:unnamed protein product [Meloidogyne enterolobii]|uniref:Uncharacterized protein n=1 Tax=Meloidogyne enterolobii TaxID=390850 RepID=A0ACB0ZNK8_MELEN